MAKNNLPFSDWKLEKAPKISTKMLKNHIQQIRKMVQYRNSGIPQEKDSDKAILQTPLLRKIIG